MASLKNASKSSQRLHRERHQPEARRHLGVLEKKKDYKLRADDYNKKKATLKQLRQKALDKNPDEFHFHMINSELRNGVHFEKEKDPYTPEQLKLMQSQDLNYVVMKRTAELKKIEKLKASLHLIDLEEKPANKRIVFVESEKEKKRKLKEAEKMLSMDTEEVDERIVQLVPKVQSERQKAYKELVKRMEREKQLRILIEKMTVKRNLLAKGSSAEKVQDGSADSAPLYKWKKERQK